MIYSTSTTIIVITLSIIGGCAALQNKTVQRSLNTYSLFDEDTWSPGAQIMAKFFKEVIARSTGNTQIVSLNLTTLLLLLLLKAIIFAAGLIGTGAWQHQYARSLNLDHSNQYFNVDYQNRDTIKRATSIFGESQINYKR
ncbi:uncharacterized protein LOC113383681 [Ctenocephalides felis]|uniref:uncharacterized protein LOC113383681 n=1 Tax=Ctenocephalides felis TaxID=7515 RepID=UPI000E6E52FC|nr:uncharacterized protein LOC113383681 [Ctenocephalides felis]